MAKSIKKTGPAVVTESGEYDSIKSIGPLTVNAPAITASSIKAMGPATFHESAVEVQEMTIQGPFTGSGNLTVENLHVNGPIKYKGDVTISESGKINGPITLEGSMTGNTEVELKINGPLEAEHIKEAKTVKINGQVETISLVNIGSLKINGKVEVDEIQVSEELTISLNSGESHIKKVSGGRIEIGLNTKTDFFNNFFSKLNKPGTAIIDEINSNGVVELDHVKVKKVIARELYAGEETEIGEYIEIQD